MDIDYRGLAKGLGASKRHGQNFLLSTEIARMEAEYARGKTVVELGPGLGILTRELCGVAKRVIAIEKDARLYEILASSMPDKNLELVNADFFDADKEIMAGVEVMVSNIPYSLSSKTTYWLAERNVPALLCMQKEFVDHMLAKPDTRNYSKLSVISALQFKVYKIKDVGAGNFFPAPRVQSTIAFIKPLGRKLDKKAVAMLNCIMEHKKKKIRNAIVDSAGMLGIDKETARSIAERLANSDERAFKLTPEKLYDTAQKLSELVPKSHR